MILKKTILVFVRYDKSIDASKFHEFVKPLFDQVYTIWNSEDECSEGRSSNEMFEFSGYREGLVKVVNQYSEGSGSDLKIVLVNDTVINGHVGFFYRLLIKSFITYWRDNSISGVVSRNRHRSMVGGYLSTWCFALNVTASQLPTLSNVLNSSRREVLESFHRESDEYRATVDTWLRPQSFLRGWYKANPWKPLDDETYNRKVVSIYLEHRILEIFDFLSLDEHVNSGLLYKLFHLMDRVYVNLIKLKYRLGYLLSRLSESV